MNTSHAGNPIFLQTVFYSEVHLIYFYLGRILNHATKGVIPTVVSTAPRNLCLQHVTPKHMVEFVQHAELYGTEQDYVRACTDLAESFVETVKQCSVFRELSCHQMLQTLLSEDLIRTEDELIFVVMKWVGCNPQAPMNEVQPP